MEALSYLIPFGIFCATVVISYRLGRGGRGRSLSSLWCFWLAFTALMIFGMQTAPGWNAILYIAGLIGISGPLAVGGVIGGAYGTMMWYNAQPDTLSKRTRHPDD